MVIANVYVTLKKGILDPQGKTVRHALENLGIDSLQDVRMGKLIQMKFEDVSESQAEKLAQDACEKLLANPVIEDYRIEVVNGY